MQRREATFAGRRAIIIGGCARSGTTLLATLLSAHPGIHLISADGEDRETGVFCRDLRKDDSALTRLRPDLASLAAEITSWCEKTPRNIRSAASTLEYFGDQARFLNIVRDGRDVVCSVHPNGVDPFAVEPRRWVRDVGAGVPLEGHPGFMTLRYEDLVRELEATLRAVCDFVGLPYHPDLLGYPKTAKVWKSGAWFGDAIPVHTRRAGRWRDEVYRVRVEKLLCEPGARELLEHYGYESVSESGS